MDNAEHLSSDSRDVDANTLNPDIDTGPATPPPEDQLLAGPLASSAIAIQPLPSLAPASAARLSIEAGPQVAPIPTVTREDAPVNDENDPSLDDFQEPRPLPKRRSDAHEESESKRSKSVEASNTASIIEQEDGQNCPICMDAWGNSGDHRIAALKCGHLFGKLCIERWLKSNPKCPTCNDKAVMKDIRVLFAKSLLAVDTTDRDEALRALENERIEKLRAQHAETKALIQNKALQAERDRLLEELEALKRRNTDVMNDGYQRPMYAPANGVSFSSTASLDAEFRLEQSLAISTDGTARILAFDQFSGSLSVSRKSSQAMLPGWGIQRISLVDTKSSEYMPLHSGMIRDLKYSPRSETSVLLSAAMDKTLKITNLQTKTVAHTYTAPAACWSCEWKLDDLNFVYCGLANGLVYVYDLRRIGMHVKEYKSSKPNPIVCLACVPERRLPMPDDGEVFSTALHSGLLAATLEALIYWEEVPDGEVLCHRLDIATGACYNVHVDPASRLCLASFRPTPQRESTQHVVFRLMNGGATVIDQVIDCEPSGSLTRNRLFPLPSPVSHSQFYLAVVAGDEKSASLKIWDSASGALKQSHPTRMLNAPILDVACFIHNHRTLCCVLNEKNLLIYKWK